MEIKDLSNIDINIRNVQINSIGVNQPPQYPIYDFTTPPVTQNIGFPIVDIPGCVEARQSNSKKLPTEDERGNLVLCDGNVPSYDPIQFEPNQIIPTKPSGFNTGMNEDERDDAPSIDDLPIPQIPPATAVIQCPTASQEAKEPVGTYLEGFRKKVIDYELIGNECVQITENVPLPEQVIAGLPSAGSVMMTGSIAVVATASALMAKPLADILLKVVKPTVKKVMKKIAAIRGKSVPVLSVVERRDQQRIRSHAIRKLRGKE